jgi:hypothetical protein
VRARSAERANWNAILRNAVTVVDASARLMTAISQAGDGSKGTKRTPGVL